MNELQWKFKDRSEWGFGAWLAEPWDKEQWADSLSGMACMIHRGSSGAWCGYVGVPPAHHLYGQHYNDEALRHIDDIHGGLTYSAPCTAIQENGGGLCHVPGAGEPDSLWWFGFDFNHLGDRNPADPSTAGGRYWTTAEAKAECAALALQIVLGPAKP